MYGHQRGKGDGRRDKLGGWDEHIPITNIEQITRTYCIA